MKLVTKPDEPKVWYTVRELSAAWGISTSWIRDHATRKEPRIKAYKFGKGLRFHRDDIQVFLAQIATINKDHAA